MEFIGWDRTYATIRFHCCPPAAEWHVSAEASDGVVWPAYYRAGYRRAAWPHTGKRPEDGTTQPFAQRVVLCGLKWLQQGALAAPHRLRYHRGARIARLLSQRSGPRGLRQGLICLWRPSRVARGHVKRATGPRAMKGIAAMGPCVVLDVSLNEPTICVMDGGTGIVGRGRCGSTREAMAEARPVASAEQSLLEFRFGRLDEVVGRDRWRTFFQTRSSPCCQFSSAWRASKTRGGSARGSTVIGAAGNFSGSSSI